MKNFVITEFNNLYIANDPTGRKSKFLNRQFSCFIITIKGKIRFTYEGGCLISQQGAPVFLPKGLTYLNECLESAESYVFNFQTLEQDHPPIQLSSVPDDLTLECYESIGG